MTSIYESLLEYYDELFPVSDEKLQFILNLLSTQLNNDVQDVLPRVLDMGCGNGNFAIQLMRHNIDVTGIDDNVPFIQSACRRNPEPRTSARFFRMGMLEAGKILAKESFDMVLCLSNILASLRGGEKIQAFLNDMRLLTKKNGCIIIELVNYERILAEKIERLPSIETQRSRFERLYTHRSDGYIDYESSLFSSSQQLVFQDRLSLYPIKADELEQYLLTSGFSTVQFKDSFKSPEYTGTDLGLICTAWR